MGTPELLQRLERCAQLCTKCPSLLAALDQEQAEAELDGPSRPQLLRVLRRLKECGLSKCRA